MIKVAIWGYGYVGKKLVKWYENNNAYEVVLVVDTNYKKLSSKERKIDCPSILKQYFDKGIIDGCVIAVNGNVSKDIYAKLIADKIDVIFPHKYLVEDIKNVCSKQINVWDSFNHYIVNNLYLQIDCYLDGWAYVNDKAIIGQMFHDEDALWATIENDYLVTKPFHELQLNPDSTIEDEIFVLPIRHSINYWHFMFNVLPHVIAAEEYGFKGKYFIHDQPHAREIMKLFNIDEKRIIYSEGIGKTFLIKKAIVGDILSPNPITAEMKMDIAFRKMSQYIQKFILDKYENETFPKYVYVKRIGARQLVGNSEQIAKKYGFEIVIPEEHNVLEQLAYFYFADIVISPHGANSTGCIAMQKDSIFIETFPYNWVHLANIEVARVLKIKYYMLAEDYDWTIKFPTAEEYKNTRRNYTIPDTIFENYIKNAIDYSNYLKN